MTDTPKLTADQLTKNASLINAAHRAVVQANKTSIEKAIEAGTILKACKDSVGHGGWSKWLYDNCRDISDETARLYMRLADEKNAPKLEEAAKQNGNAVADLSVRGAAKLLAKPQTPETKAKRTATIAAKKAEAEANFRHALSSDLTGHLKAVAPDEVFKALKDAGWDAEELTKLVGLLNTHLAELKATSGAPKPVQQQQMERRV
jgi:hypothetical protein